MNKQHGFTLLETLLVLLIVGVITFFSIRIIAHTQQKEEMEQFFQNLKADVALTQSYAMATGVPTHLLLRTTEQTYKVYQIGKTIKEVPYPPSVKLKNIGALVIITYLSNGSISQFSTYYFSRERMSDYRMTTNLGKGRVRFSEM